MSASHDRRTTLVPARWAVLGVGVMLAALGGVRVVPWAAASTSSGDRAIFEPLTPARILDTRSPSNPIGAGQSRLLQVTGAGGVPADATAVVMNVTAVSPTATSFLTVYPADVARPNAANLNYVAGQPPVPNLVTVRLSATGQVQMYNNAGQVHVVVDVAGYYRGHDHDDRYYTKANTQARLAADSLTCPAGQFLAQVAADGTPTCGVGAEGPPGPTGPAGPSGPKGFASQSGLALPASGFEHHRAVTAPFVVPVNVTSCVVDSTVQMQPVAGAPNDVVYFRNAVSRNGVFGDDGQYGHYLYNDGAGRKQPPMSRSSVVTVTPGQSVAFGVYFGSLDLAPAWYNQPYAAVTSYLCS